MFVHEADQRKPGLSLFDWQRSSPGYRDTGIIDRFVRNIRYFHCSLDAATMHTVHQYGSRYRSVCGCAVVAHKWRGPNEQAAESADGS